MTDFVDKITSLLPEGFHYEQFFTLLAIIVVAFLALGLIGRFVFGKKSVFHGSVSSVLGILFIYALAIVVHSTGISLGFMLGDLPFITLSGETLSIFPLTSADYTVICGQLLNMVILAFIVNIIDRWMPTGKKLVGWLVFRFISVLLGVVAYTFLVGFLNTLLPEGLLLWAPVILLALLVLSLLLGALKFVVGAVLTTLNPLLAVLYTFFFSSILGKMVSKAILTTVMMTALVFLMITLGITQVLISVSVLIAYIPLLLVLLFLWFMIGKVLVK